MMKRLAKLPIRAYQLFVSPLLGTNCRYAPTCSCYALEAVEVHGAFKGGFLALKRILRCHPFAAHGHDERNSGKQEREMH